MSAAASAINNLPSGRLWTSTFEHFWGLLPTLLLRRLCIWFCIFLKPAAQIAFRTPLDTTFLNLSAAYSQNGSRMILENSLRASFSPASVRWLSACLWQLTLMRFSSSPEMSLKTPLEVCFSALLGHDPQMVHRAFLERHFRVFLQPVTPMALLALSELDFQRFRNLLPKRLSGFLWRFILDYLCDLLAKLL